MDIDRAFADPTLEAEGVWVDYREGSRVKIARLGNAAFQKAHESKQRPYRKLIRDGRLPAQVSNRVLCEALAETVLLDWDGFNKKGKTLKYSAEAATKLLIERMDFRDEIALLATEEETFRQKIDGDSEKNSGTSSPGI